MGTVCVLAKIGNWTPPHGYCYDSALSIMLSWCLTISVMARPGVMPTSTWTPLTHLLWIFTQFFDKRWPKQSRKGITPHFSIQMSDIREIREADVTFELFTAATMKNAMVWDVMPCGSCKNRRVGGSYRLNHQGDKNRPARNISSN
jgi:hypothetical protein